MDDSLIGQNIGRYRIIERLGRGGMAEVYKGYDENLERFVAIKLMHPFLASEEDFIGRFRREAKAMAALNHANIVKVYDFDASGNRTYIVMEYLSQGTLKDKLEDLARRGQKISLAEAIQVVLQIADALSYAHSRGMIHRDIKPPNIMFNDYGAAILSDFGIAKVVSGPTFTQTGAMIGSPAYMSPEQGLGKPGDERSDIYSLGVLFFQLATGQLPFAADTPLAVALKHVNAPIPDPSELNPAIPEGVREVIVRAMAKEPDERFPTAKAMADALREVLRTADATLLQALPAALLKEQPTPPPLSGVITTPPGTQARPPLDKTQVVTPPDKTMVATPVGVDTGSRGVNGGSGRKIPWVLIGGVAMVLLLLAVAFGGYALAQVRNDDASTPTSALAAVTEETPEPTLTEAPAVIDNPTETVAPTSTPTTTPTLTPTTVVDEPPTLAPTFTATTDATATHTALCLANPAVRVVNYYTYQNTQSKSAPVNVSNMRLNFVLENNGTQGCSWPTDLQLVYVEGRDFGLSQPVVVPGGLAPGANTTITVNNLRTPAQSGSYESTWQLKTSDGELFGPPIVFTLTIFVPTTPTPTPSPTPAVTPTPAAALNFTWAIASCEYPGGADTAQEFRCTLFITPSGGSGLYTIEVFDATPPTRYERRTGGVQHYINGRRCFPWINEVNVIDENTGIKVTQNIYFDPKVGPYFPGGQGCKMPGET
ncbi:MAG: protein kinase [Anaerolineae bacterium]|nr:protein kinase [Anaerolineae bacterium]